MFYGRKKNGCEAAWKWENGLYLLQKLHCLAFCKFSRQQRRTHWKMCFEMATTELPGEVTDVLKISKNPAYCPTSGWKQNGIPAGRRKEGQEKTGSERGAACHSSSKGQQAWLKSARHRSPDPCLMCVWGCVCHYHHCGSSLGITAGAEDVSNQPQASEQLWGI